MFNKKFLTVILLSLISSSLSFKASANWGEKVFNSFTNHSSYEGLNPCYVVEKNDSNLLEVFMSQGDTREEALDYINSIVNVILPLLTVCDSMSNVTSNITSMLKPDVVPEENANYNKTVACYTQILDSYLGKCTKEFSKDFLIDNPFSLNKNQ